MQNNFLNYIPASLHQGKDYYVSYYVLNPSTNKLKIKKIRLNFIKSKNEQKKYARNLVNEINIKLAQGWNPFIEQEAPRGFAKLFDVIDVFLKNKKKELRKDSIRCYKSNMEILKFWLKEIKNEPDLYVISFNQVYANNYMSYIYNERDVSERVFNNYKNFGVTFWNWLIENQYCKTNVFKIITKKREQEKIRDIIDENTRVQLKNYLIDNDEIEFLCVCLLTYHCLIRPKEICYLKKGNIDLKKNMITITPEVSKTNKLRHVTIPDSLVNYLKLLNFDKINDQDFIFSTGFKPGKVLKDSRYVGKKWDKIRKCLKMPASYQFYSLKDSGIIQMLRDGISPEIVRDQAGHSSLEMTNKYIKIANIEAQQQILNKASDF